MSGSLKVILPGLATTVQDLGRTGGQRLGIPVSGAADPTALRAANVVVGNAQEIAGLEIALAGPTLEVAADSIRVAVSGGTTVLQIIAADGSDSRRIGPMESVRLARGDRVRVQSVVGSAVAYVAVEGGFDLPRFEGSHSTYVRGGFGGLDGRALREGDSLRLTLNSVPERDELRLPDFELKPQSHIRLVLGPQDDYFSAAAIETLLSGTYTISRETDRMGMRLDGPSLEHIKGFNIVSDGIAPGSIQVPGNGLPIILLVDRQSTGGYPKIATVASVDLPALGRASPGMALTFGKISVEDAQVLRRSHEAWMRGLAGLLVPARAAGPNLAMLYSENLISGVSDGR